MTLILSRSDVTGLVTLDEVIAAVEQAHADMALRRAAQPSPATMALPSGPGLFLAMTALADRQGLAAAKVLADIPGNAAMGLPTQRSIVALVSQETGACEAIFHGQIPTRMRTAAASAVATKFLARKDATTLGLIGAGALAREHLAAISLVRDIARVVVWSRTVVSATRFAEEIRAAYPRLAVESAATAQDAVAAADILCTLTPSREPVVMGEWFSPGLHVNAVGAPPRPDHREIDATGMARARIVVDSIATTLHESGDALMAIAEGAITPEDVSTELGEVITGAKAGRTSADEITLFNSVGIAMQDLAIGALILERARAKGIGVEVDLGR